MIMKNKLVRFTLVGSAVTMLYGFSNDSTAHDAEFKVISTSYSKPFTSIQVFKNFKMVETKQYNISGVTKISDGLIFDMYGDTLIDLKSKDKSVHKTEVNPLNIKRVNDGLVSLNNSNLNEFSITKYTTNYKKSQGTKRFVGHARDFIIDQSNIYVLANVYGETSRDVTLYTIDRKSLKVKSVKIIPQLTFGFYFKKIDQQIKIYGNLTEENEELAISTYNIKTKSSELTLTVPESVVWVSKTKQISNQKELLLNVYSLLEVDYKTKQVKRAYASKNALIDFRYHALERCYYVLEGDVERRVYSVTVLNQKMKKIKSSIITPPPHTFPVKLSL